jgi:quercetin dioxygenase-like cupin family protein
MSILQHIQAIKDIDLHRESEKVIYHLPVGSSCGQVLKNIPEISVVDNCLFAGSETDFHYHDEQEYFILYQGQLKITFEKGDTITVNAGEYATIYPKQIHKVETLSDTFLISISIPRLKMYTDEQFIQKDGRGQ